LPKFEVTINLPSVVLEKDKKFQMEICGRYTQGKPVLGSVQARLCHYPRRHIPEGRACTSISGQTEKNGCFSMEVLLSTFNMAQWMNRTLEVQASLEEDGTGLEMKSTKSIEILPEGFTVTFEYPNEVYKPGIPYSGTFLLKGADGVGVPQRQILLSVSMKGKEDQTHTIVTDRSGRASFKLDTSGWTGHVSVKGEVNRTPQTQNDDSTDSYSDAQMKIMPFYSESGSFLEIRQVEGELPSGKPYKLWADFIFSQKALETELKTVDVIVLVTAKGTIANVLRKQLPAKAGVRDSFYVEVPISLELAPMAMALCYVVLPNGEMVADSMELYVVKSLPNKVKMAFSEDRTLPGTALQLQLEAAPGSLCATRAVDRSVLLLEPEAELNAEAVSGDPAQGPSAAPGTSLGWEGWDDIGLDLPYKALVLQWLQGSPAPAQAVGAGLVLHVCLFTVLQSELITFFTMTGSLGNIQESKETTNSGTDDQEELPAPRMYFPETWLWDLVPVGEGGSAEVTVTVPDAITEWKAQTFCTAPQGLGLSPAITLTPFFVELALPYTMVCHETFTLVATVFNHLWQYLKVSRNGDGGWGLALGADEAMVVLQKVLVVLEVLAGAEDEYGGCVCGEEVMTSRWGMQATSLG
ncbi:A2ML1 protein, partial [Campylorhamphus procurvoides]|nr:A2ML1 protein [Campylorhamphus procurvoides]